MPPKRAAAAPPTPLGEVDANRVTAPAAGTAKLTTVTTLKPAPKSRKRKSDAVEGDSAAASAPAPKKAATKKKEDPMPDLSGIHLPGDESMSVPVYDTCSTVRTKINALLKKDGVTKAGFLRACVKAAYGAESTHKTAPSLLANFLAKKGPTGGNTSSVFYAAYVFFEKLRIRDGKAKTKTREEMEATWGAEGFDREHDASRGVWCHASEAATVDKHGKLHIVPRGGGRPRGGWF
ncbi:hypothetical protein CkaCkLH20_01869 [Colletotrichum karsti]|uniref:DUF7726 domain-containing protein n=1 Tax=Colletotrichum karsti TaxID=1095194 RepID=A0A9P6ICE5_9PEZI|nr:uncharacterized protein CkaCkLH20_01869 [Colletotrichum karsti]KAF9880827.1 hypothetical protein CkaCkLH20_01869 [Colletotrichum karsti]